MTNNDKQRNILFIDLNERNMILAFAMIFAIASCQRSNDKPPDMDGPVPEPHQGVFVSQNAVFTFDGDNKTVFVEFDDEYLKALDNPPNNTYYSYAFTWYDFGEYRYDGATSLKLRIPHDIRRCLCFFGYPPLSGDSNVMVNYPRILHLNIYKNFLYILSLL